MGGRLPTIDRECRLNKPFADIRQQWFLSVVVDKSAVIASVCLELTESRTERAVQILTSEYPHVAATRASRRFTAAQALAIFARDGFVDRYSGQRLIFPGTLRMISLLMPEHFPFQRNWRADLCHIAYYELCPTIDHVVPVSRGGPDVFENWVTTSMIRNSAKSLFTLEELGWKLFEIEECDRWDGLVSWFLEQVQREQVCLSDTYLRKWFAVARAWRNQGAAS